MNNLAAAYRVLGRDAEAEPLLVGAQEARRRVLGDDHPKTLNSLDNLLALYRDQSRDAEAGPRLREKLGRLTEQALRPGADAALRNHAAWELLTHDLETVRDPEQALELARRASPSPGHRFAL